MDMCKAYILYTKFLQSVELKHCLILVLKFVSKQCSILPSFVNQSLQIAMSTSMNRNIEEFESDLGFLRKALKIYRQKLDCMKSSQGSGFNNLL